MSKSKNNIVQPQKLLEQYGTDVVRYWTATARLGRDTAFSEDVLKVGKRLVTKLVNAAKFVAPHVGGFDGQTVSAADDAAQARITATLDLWLLTRLAETIEAASNHFEACDYTDALDVTERFFFGDFCDNYLELVKGRVYGEVGNEADKCSGQLTLGHALKAILTLFAPFLPFTAEQVLHDTLPEMAQALGSIHARGNWPRAEQFPRDAEARRSGEASLAVLSMIRGAKSERGVSQKAPLGSVTVATPVDLSSLAADLRQTVSAFELLFRHAEEFSIAIVWPNAENAAVTS